MIQQPFPKQTTLVEVGLRDGLQAVASPILETSKKVEIVEQLIEAGVTHIEAVSFAHPKVLPQLADAEELLALVPRDRGITYRGLIPNLRGAQRAAATELDEWVLVVSADSDVSVRNQNRTTEEMISELQEIAALAKTVNTTLVVTIACSLFAPARGPVPREETLRVLEAAVDLGVQKICLAGTTGQEHPKEIFELVSYVTEQWEHLEVGFHLHNRNGFAPANALAALAGGATWLESGFLGLGGDMWFPGAPEILGNAATEDMVHLLSSMGIETGIDLDTYLQAVASIEAMLDTKSYSFVTRGGTRNDLANAEWPNG